MRPAIHPARCIHPVIFVTAFVLCAAASISRASDAITSAWSTGHPGGPHRERRECLRAAMDECSKWRQLRGSAWYNDLWDVCWLPGTDLMWAVGESIVCRSYDGGYYWHISQPALESDSLPGATVTFYCVHFHDSLIGWAAGRAKIMASAPVIFGTTDGGESWHLQYEGPIASNEFWDIEFVDSLTGWAAGVIDPDSQLNIVHTNDGGASWTPQPSGLDAGVTGIEFMDASVGYATDQLKYVLKTTDGGDNWTVVTQNVDFVDFLLDMEFIDDMHGFGVDYRSDIWRTGDGGVTWDNFRGASVMRDIEFADSNHGWTVGTYGATYFTHDGGDTWEQSTFTSDHNDLKACAVKDSCAVWSVGDLGTIVHTIDCGEYWRQIDGVGYVSTASLTDAKFYNDAIGWVVGFGGEIIRTVDGGRNWIHHHDSETNFSDVEFVDSLHGWAVGGGEIWHTDDGGAAWHPQDTLGTTLTDAFFVTRNIGWVCGISGCIYHTNDGGVTWNPQASPTGESLYGISFVDETTGWIVGWNGTVLFTMSGGLAWIPMPFSVVEPLYQVDFIDSDHGWIAGLDHIYATDDGGLSWDIQHTEYEIGALNCIDFTDAQHGYAGGGRVGVSWIYYTDNGGDTWQLCNLDHLEYQEKIGGVCVVHPDVVYAVGKAQVLKLDTTSPGGIPDIPAADRSIVLHRNYPNPFNPATTIRFDLPHPAHVRLCVYTVKGELVTTLVDRRMPGGRSEIVWTSRDSRERAVSSGIYFYRLVAGDFVQTKKMVLLR